MNNHSSILLAAALVVTVPAVAQNEMPGAPEASRVTAGNYAVDPTHTQVIWSVSHLGITPLAGTFGASGGTLEIDPANLSTAKVNVTFNIGEMTTNVPAFTNHMKAPDIFDVAKFPKATFTSTAVQASGSNARITGNLTLRGVTKPITLDAKFYGAGINPLKKKLQIGFTATGSVKRSDFGLGYALPRVGDQIDLQINAAFERVG